MGVSPALRAAPGRGRAVQGSAALRCCAQLPLVAPLPSLTYFSRDSARPPIQPANGPGRARKSAARPYQGPPPAPAATPLRGPRCATFPHSLRTAAHSFTTLAGPLRCVASRAQPTRLQLLPLLIATPAHARPRLPKVGQAALPIRPSGRAASRRSATLGITVTSVSPSGPNHSLRSGSALPSPPAPVVGLSKLSPPTVTSSYGGFSGSFWYGNVEKASAQKQPTLSHIPTPRASQRAGARLHAPQAAPALTATVETTGSGPNAPPPGSNASLRTGPRRQSARSPAPNVATSQADLLPPHLHAP